MKKLVLMIVAVLMFTSVAEATGQRFISIPPQAVFSRRSVVIQPRQTFVVRPQRVFVAPQRVIVRQPQAVVIPQQFYAAPQQVIAVPQRIHVAPQFQFNAGCPQQLNGGY